MILFFRGGIVLLTNNININNNENIESFFGTVISKDNDYYKVMINNIEYNNIRSLSKVDYNINEKVLLIHVNDVYFIIGSYDKKHDADTSDCIKKSDIIDTGWVSIPLNDAFSSWSEGNKPMYRQIGGLVFIRGLCYNNQEFGYPDYAQEYYISRKLPASIIPPTRESFIKGGSGKLRYELFITTDGYLKITKILKDGVNHLSPITANTTFYINCCYCLDDDILGMVNNIIESVGDYNTLTNKPSLNGQTLIGDTTLDIPTDLSDLREDTEHNVVTVDEIRNWNNKVDSTELANYTKTVDLDNLISTFGYLKTHQSLENYYTKSETDNVVSTATNDMATQTWVNQQGYLTSVPVLSVNGKTGSVVLTPSDLGLGSVFKIKGSKPTKNDLPSTNNEIGDVWYVIDESVGYIWLNDGTTNRWEQLGLEVDLSNYVTITQLNNSLLNYVQKVTGKDLSTNDFTNSLKSKLEGLSNYDDTEIRTLIGNLQNSKQDNLVSGTNIKTINNESLLGSGNITIQGGGGTSNYNDLSNKPSLNGQTLIGDTTLDIPTNLSDLNEDSNHKVVTETQISNWNGKQDNLVSGSNIKTINNESLLGSGNLNINEDFVLVDSTSNVEIYESKNFVNINFTGTYTFGGGTGWETIYTGLSSKPRRNVVCNIGSPLVNNALNRCYGLISSSGNIGVGCYNARSNISIYGNFVYNKWK